MKFELVALENLAKLIGDYNTGSQITGLFKKAGFPEIVHDDNTKWRFVYDTFEKMQEEKYGFYDINKVIESFCNPQEYFSNPDDHQTIIDKVNRILIYYNLKVGNNGKIIKTDTKTEEIYKVNKTPNLFLQRKFHPEVVRNGKDLFNEKRYFHAVFECIKALEKYVQRKAKSNLSGVKLMTQELSMNGSLKINSQRTQTEMNEQEGVRDLCRGLMMSIRNYTAHELALEKPITEEDALDILSLVSYLYRKIDNSVYFNNKK